MSDYREQTRRYIELRQQGMSAQEAFAQVFPNGIERAQAEDAADAANDQAAGQVAGLVGGLVVGKGAYDLVTDKPLYGGIFEGEATQQGTNVAAQQAGGEATSAVAPEVATPSATAPTASSDIILESQAQHGWGGGGEAAVSGAAGGAAANLATEQAVNQLIASSPELFGSQVSSAVAADIAAGAGTQAAAGAGTTAATGAGTSAATTGTGTTAAAGGSAMAGGQYWINPYIAAAMVAGLLLDKHGRKYVGKPVVSAGQDVLGAAGIGGGPRETPITPESLASSPRFQQLPGFSELSPEEQQGAAQAALQMGLIDNSMVRNEEQANITDWGNTPAYLQPGLTISGVKAPVESLPNIRPGSDALQNMSWHDYQDYGRFGKIANTSLDAKAMMAGMSPEELLANQSNPRRAQIMEAYMGAVKGNTPLAAPPNYGQEIQALAGGEQPQAIQRPLLQGGLGNSNMPEKSTSGQLPEGVSNLYQSGNFGLEQIPQDSPLAQAMMSSPYYAETQQWGKQMPQGSFQPDQYGVQPLQVSGVGPSQPPQQMDPSLQEFYMNNPQAYQNRDANQLSLQAALLGLQ